MLLDTRVYGRDQQITDATLDGLNDGSRTLLGQRQETWLSDQLGRPGATRLLLANHVVLTPLRAKAPEVLPDGAAESADILVLDDTALNADHWDGHPAAQQRLLGQLASRPGGGVVVLTGDITARWRWRAPPAPIARPRSARSSPRR
ncbi:MAG TPA: alkaline phosphatase D family protein [Acidimicrobiia bacterium]|nr:alkaline phosphatase D family protein [Acidimicrobiia bacterium]